MLLSLSPIRCPADADTDDAADAAPPIGTEEGQTEKGGEGGIGETRQGEWMEEAAEAEEEAGEGQEYG